MPNRPTGACTHPACPNRSSYQGRCLEHVRRPYADTAYRKQQMIILNTHRELYGEWCPGAQEIAHQPHLVEPGNFLTVDHIDGDASNNARANLRVVCNRANLSLAQRG